MKLASEILSDAARTFLERRTVYGDNWKRAAEALAALFPEGIKLKSANDHARFHIFVLIVVKLSRYAVAWKKGHRDSVHDACVYSAMLESIDAELYDEAEHDAGASAENTDECGMAIPSRRKRKGKTNWES